MSNPSVDLTIATSRVNWVRMRTLILLRWIAITGQFVSVLVAEFLFRLQLEFGFAFAAIGASITVNLIQNFVYPENKRLTETELALNLIYDISQLAFLLYLTGGLHNPFALLILVPVTVSATALHVRTTMAIGAYAIMLITFVAQINVPLRTELGFTMWMPTDFVVGFWVAIVIGIAFLSTFAQRVTAEVHAMSDALAATQMALAREQKLTDLGGVVAAAAHELGTPLATIKLVSSELREDVEEKMPELREDIELIGEQADRCRDILRSMGQAGKEDKHMKRAPITAVIREAAEPHRARGVRICFDARPAEGGDPRQPLIYRTPEMIHGLRNLVQNAVDFARSRIWIDIRWDARTITLRIIDDGPGFPPSHLSRIGDPFVHYRRGGTESGPSRPGYEGMGLGLFIAKTLLERSGAELSFANGHDPYTELPLAGTRSGAVVDLTWPTDAIAVDSSEIAHGLGENLPIEA